MQKDKNSKKNRVERLRSVLDTPDNRKLYPGDEKHLKALARRLKESSEEDRPKNYVTYTGKKEDDDFLKPRVTVYPRKIKKEVKKKEEEKVVTAPPKEFITMEVEKKEIKVKDEDIFEVDKLQVKEKKFVKVKPKEVVKQKESKKTVKDELTEWKTVEAEKPVIEKEVEEGTWETVDSGEYKIKDQKEDEKPNEFIQVKKAEKTEETFPTEELDSKKEEEDLFEEAVVEKEVVQEVIDDGIKNEVFKDIQAIDNETANILFSVGFTTLESIRSTSVADLSYVTGIKKSKVKKIKKEIERKSEKPKQKEKKKKKEKRKKEPKEEIVKENFEVEEFLPYEEKPTEVEPLDVADTAEWEITADELIDEEEISPNKIKIDSFKDLKSVDAKTAVLLYDNGYADVDHLKSATEDELKKIKGLKKKKVKEIMKEVRGIIDESVKAKDIDLDLTANALITKEQIEEDVIEEEEILLSDSAVELESDKAEWIPLPDKDADAEEKKEFLNQKIEKVKVTDENKIEAFKDLKTVDDITAITLYDGGFKSIGEIRKASLKQLYKVKGIKKSLIKQIKKEADEYVTVEDAISNDDEIKFIDEEVVSEEEFSSLDSQISDHFKIEDEVVEEFEEKKPEGNGIENFKEIKSIDGKIAKLLVENGIYSVEDLRGYTIKDLTKIRGIRKKVAKEIKSEVESIKIEEPKPKKTKTKKEAKKKSKKPKKEAKPKKSKKKKKSERDNPKQYYISENNDDFKVFDVEQFNESDEIYKHGDYTLYEKEIQTNSKKRLIVRFFSKEKPDDAYPVRLPEGYESIENGTGVPYLKKKK